jgi:hypothetical protein
MNEEINNEIDIELDQEWIDKFEDIDKNYTDFYLEDVVSIKAHFIYINKNRDVEKIKREKIILNHPNVLSRDELLLVLKENMSEKNSSYFLSVILKYNITLESNEIRKYCASKYSPEDYVSYINSIDAITFKKTITMFQDLNHLFFVFIEKDKESSKNKTKRFVSIKTVNHNKTHRK